MSVRPVERSALCTQGGEPLRELVIRELIHNGLLDREMRLDRFPADLFFLVRHCAFVPLVIALVLVTVIFGAVDRCQRAKKLDERCGGRKTGSEDLRADLQNKWAREAPGRRPAWCCSQACKSSSVKVINSLATLLMNRFVMTGRIVHDESCD